MGGKIAAPVIGWNNYIPKSKGWVINSLPKSKGWLCVHIYIYTYIYIYVADMGLTCAPKNGYINTVIPRKDKFFLSPLVHDSSAHTVSLAMDVWSTRLGNWWLMEAFRSLKWPEHGTRPTGTLGNACWSTLRRVSGPPVCYLGSSVPSNWGRDGGAWALQLDTPAWRGEVQPPDAQVGSGAAWQARGPGIHGGGRLPPPSDGRG